MKPFAANPLRQALLSAISKQELPRPTEKAPSLKVPDDKRLVNNDGKRQDGKRRY
jgi:hypothetical protein